MDFGAPIQTVGRRMHWYLWLAIGIVVGLVARPVMGENTYGVSADVLLGLAGALIAGWIVRIPNIDSRVSWAGKSSLVIWGAASLPFLARMAAKLQAARKTPSLGSPVPATQTKHQPFLVTQHSSGRQTELLADKQQLISPGQPISDDPDKSGRCAS